MSTRRTRRRRSGFTLVELLVVAAILVAMIVVVMPGIKGVVQGSQKTQAANTLRAALLSARHFAVQKSTVAALRCQDDGRLIVCYAVDSNKIPDDFTTQQIYSMRAAPGLTPAQLPGPWRVTYGDVGRYNEGSDFVTDADMKIRWIGPTASGYPGPPEWMSADEAWFANPIVMFSSTGKLLFNECYFDGSSSNGWHPAMAMSDPGSFAHATSRKPNNNPIPPHPYIKYTNQLAVAGWRGGNYKGTSNHEVPVEAPSMTARPRLFDFKAVIGMTDKMAAVQAIYDTRMDFTLELETGLVVRP